MAACIVEHGLIVRVRVCVCVVVRLPECKLAGQSELDSLRHSPSSFPFNESTHANGMSQVENSFACRKKEFELWMQNVQIKWF